MTVRWWLVAAFGPGEAGPMWPPIVLGSVALMLFGLGYRLRKAA